jgi:hypothetical protein
MENFSEISRTVYREGTLAQVDAAIKAGADVNARDGYWTPLFYAAESNPNPEVIAILVKAGADMNAKDECGRTPLLFATRNPNPEVFAALVKAGADVNAQDNNGERPLFWAETDSNLHMIEALVKAGADVNAKGPYGRTVLAFAVISGNLEMVAALVKAGAYADAKDRNGETPLTFSDNKPEIAELLKSARRTKEGCFIATACYGDYNAPDVLIFRSFRDQALQNTQAGRWFVEKYYTYSPRLAQSLQEHRMTCSFIRRGILSPIAWSLRCMHSQKQQSTNT